MVDIDKELLMNFIVTNSVRMVRVRVRVRARILIINCIFKYHKDHLQREKVDEFNLIKLKII